MAQFCGLSQQTGRDASQPQHLSFVWRLQLRPGSPRTQMRRDPQNTLRTESEATAQPRSPPQSRHGDGGAGLRGAPATPVTSRRLRTTSPMVLAGRCAAPLAGPAGMGRSLGSRCQEGGRAEPCGAAGLPPAQWRH